jgi:hypothetical protein
MRSVVWAGLETRETNGDSASASPTVRAISRDRSSNIEVQASLGRPHDQATTTGWPPENFEENDSRSRTAEWCGPNSACAPALDGARAAEIAPNAAMATAIARVARGLRIESSVRRCTTDLLVNAGLVPRERFGAPRLRQLSRSCGAAGAAASSRNPDRGPHAAGTPRCEGQLAA